MITQTIFLSNPCYLPIHEVTAKHRFTKVWTNFVREGREIGASFPDCIREWNGTLINDVIMFDTEQDKMWFVLRWS